MLFVGDLYGFIIDSKQDADLDIFNRDHDLRNMLHDMQINEQDQDTIEPEALVQDDWMGFAELSPAIVDRAAKNDLIDIHFN